MVRRLGSSGLFVAFALCLVLLSSSAVAAAPTTYTDPQGRFSFTVPDGYTTFDAGDFATVGYRSPTYPGANVLLTVVKSDLKSDGSTLNQIGTGALKTASSQVKNLQPDPSGIQPTTVAGYAAVKYGYSASLDNGLFRGQQYAFIVGGNVYALTFSARDADFAAFMREASVVLTSFSVSGTAGAGTVTAPVAPPAAAGSPSSATPTTAPAVPTASPSRYFIRRLGDG